MANKLKSKETEDKLKLLQTKYFESEDKNIIYQEMLPILIPYAESIIKSKLSARTYIEPDEINGRAIDCCLELLQMYSKSDRKTGKKWQITDSFGAMLKWRVVHNLYNDKQKDIDQVLFIEDVMKENPGNLADDVAEGKFENMISHYTKKK